MKPTSIFQILDLTRKANENGHRFNPLFNGPAGIGKSEIIQQWCKTNGLPFIDVRAAYLEAPDMIGFPSIEEVNGKKVTVHNTPNIWPQDPNWEGVIFLDEVNRGQTSIMNCCMQLLTDRKVHQYELPKKALIVSAVNPENDQNDVNTMDSALKNRFVIFDVKYDKQTFMQYMKDEKYDPNIVLFVETGTWSYTPPEEMGNIAGSQYISPRTFSYLNAMLQAGLEKGSEIEMIVYESILGRNVGKSFLQFVHDDHPVTYEDLVKNTRKALKKIKEFSDPKNYKAAHISLTIRDIVEKKVIEDDLLSEVLLTLPADQGPGLLSQLEYERIKQNDKEKAGFLTQRIYSSYPKVREYLKDTLKK